MSYAHLFTDIPEGMDPNLFTTDELESFNQPGLKICSDCKQPLPTTAFSLCSASKDMLQGKCDDCFKKYYADPINHERHMKVVKQYQVDNPERALASDISSAIGDAIKRGGYTKPNNTGERILGMTYNQFINYLNDNPHGYYVGQPGIDKDHIVPIKLPFKLTYEDVCHLCHYTNWRLMKSNHNRSKSNKLPRRDELPANLLPEVMELYEMAVSC